MTQISGVKTLSIPQTCSEYILENCNCSRRIRRVCAEAMLLDVCVVSGLGLNEFSVSGNSCSCSVLCLVVCSHPESVRCLGTVLLCSVSGAYLL